MVLRETLQFSAAALTLLGNALMNMPLLPLAMSFTKRGVVQFLDDDRCANAEARQTAKTSYHLTSQLLPQQHELLRISKFTFQRRLGFISCLQLPKHHCNKRYFNFIRNQQT